MPLRDHFHSPVNDTHSWDELHGGWPMEIVRHLTLTVNGQPQSLRVADHLLTQPPGQGGLPTLRLAAVLETRQPFVAPLAAGEKAGIMKLMRDNVTVAEFPVVALEDVPVGGFLSRGWDTLRLLFRH